MDSHSSPNSLEQYLRQDLDPDSLLALSPVLFDEYCELYDDQVHATALALAIKELAGGEYFGMSHQTIAKMLMSMSMDCIRIAQLLLGYPENLRDRKVQALPREDE